MSMHRLKAKAEGRPCAARKCGNGDSARVNLRPMSNQATFPVTNEATQAAPRAQVDALLFDLGNVLLDVDFHCAFREWAQSADVPVETIAARFKQDAAYDAHERGEISGAQYFAALRTMLEIDLTGTEFAQGWSSILRGVIPGADTLLATLAATTPVYIFSNTNALHFARWGTDYPALLAPVTQVFCSHAIGLRKPAAAAFNKVCALMNTAPGRVAFFDDLPENVAGARRCGLQAFQVTSLDDIRHALAHGIMLSR